MPMIKEVDLKINKVQQSVTSMSMSCDPWCGPAEACNPQCVPSCSPSCPPCYPFGRCNPDLFKRS
jgi:hypothetical protein